MPEIKIDLSVKEIYKAVCPECKKTMEQMVKGKLADEMVKKALEGGEGR